MGAIKKAHVWSPHPHPTQLPYPRKKGPPDPTHLLDLPSQTLYQCLAFTWPWYLGSLPIEWEQSK